MRAKLFVMAGGGTGGHVIPGIAVARELRRMGHEVLFVGTGRGVENKLVPAAGFRLEKIRVGGMKNLGLVTRLASAWRLVAETMEQVVKFGEWEPAAVFSMGGYVAGPPVLAALLRGVPLVVMEPNAIPGATNRYVARWVTRALINFEETARYFPAGRTELTGVPVREEFFQSPVRPEGGGIRILITGGSQGSRTLNEAARAAWPLFRGSEMWIRIVHQTGTAMYEQIAAEFAKTGLAGEVVPFITDMPAAFAEADLVVCRSGAGTVSELAAAGKPSILIPFPFAADNHQLRNAEAFVRAGAAVLSLDREWTGEKFFETVRALASDRSKLDSMGESARKLAHAGAARRAAEILVEISEVR
ncbi:MAG TPA: undecaprenyldiphospho-muramoylpentapeptide beta-N-acetylglucosaminyltransferase [Bryobacteraceae bacterium]|nr:undecaprenyldiphospho-muramoylpentapeptide beta-N-acetylglucosaminyltransferase [Bryobacteraceae bacterium]